MNIMTNDAHWHSYGMGTNDRMTIMESQEVAAYYMPRNRRQEAKKEEGCIKAPQSVVGGRFDVSG